MSRSKYFTLGILVAIGITASAATVSYFGPSSTDQLGVSLATLISGEDQTNNVLRTESQFSRCDNKAADAACKSSAGFVHTVTCTSADAAATAGDIAIRDSTSAGTGTVVLDIAIPAAYFSPVTITLDEAFITGIYLDFTTTADVNCNVSYR